MTTILGVRLEERLENACDLQKIATEFGCYIKTRIGLHDASENACAPHGIVLFEFIDKDKANEFEKNLSGLQGAQIRKMEF